MMTKPSLCMRKRFDASGTFECRAPICCSRVSPALCPVVCDLARVLAQPPFPALADPDSASPGHGGSSCTGGPCALRTAWIPGRLRPSRSCSSGGRSCTRARGVKGRLLEHSTALQPVLNGGVLAVAQPLEHVVELKVCRRLEEEGQHLHEQHKVQPHHVLKRCSS